MSVQGPAGERGERGEPGDEGYQVDKTADRNPHQTDRHVITESYVFGRYSLFYGALLKQCLIRFRTDHTRWR